MQLFTHEFCDLLPVDTLSVGPLHRVVGNFDYEAHVRSLTDAVIGEFLEVRNRVILPGLCDHHPTVPLTLTGFHVRSSAASLVFSEGF